MFQSTQYKILGIPIDVNVAYKPHLIFVKECYHYGDPNHMVCDCPARLDVQQLTIEQQEELIENLNDIEIV